MGYMGGKYLVGPHLIAALVLHTSVDDLNDAVWCEPFCGSLALTYHLLEVATPRQLVLCDANRCLVRLWERMVLDGWDPPDAVPTRVEFLVCKRSPDSLLRWRAVKDDPVTDDDFVKSDVFPRPVTPEWIAWVGLVASFRGGYLGQYEQNATKVEWAMKTVRRIVERLRGVAERITFRCCDFARSLEGLPLERCVVVCDPPYLQCTGYGGVIKKFDDELFWRRWLWQLAGRCADVFVCEYYHNAVLVGLDESVVWTRVARHGWADRYSRDEKLKDCLMRITPDSNKAPS